MVRNRQWLYVVVAVLLAALSAGASGGASRAQGNPTPIPLATLAQPTPLPLPPTDTATPRPSQSAVARIKARTSVNNRPLLIVGIPFNIPPFARITETGTIEGFEADLARAIAEDWGTDIEFRQVTRHNALAMLLSGQIDFLIGQQLVTRDVQTGIDFSTPYFANRQVALALNDSPYTDINQLAGQPVGVVSGSRSEEALKAWSATTGVQVAVTSFPMLDDTLRALFDNRIVALVGDRWELDQRVGGGKVVGLKLLNGAVRIEPYGIAMIRYDASLHTLTERTLQRLADSDRLNQIYKRWFPNEGDLLPEDRLIPVVWAGLKTDQRTLNEYENDIVYPAQPVIDRIKAGQPLRVAGLGEPVGAGGQPSPLEGFNRAMIEEMARRWGAQIEYVPNSFGAGEDVLASGAADIAVGMEAQWGTVDRIDLAGIYAQRGYRLMVRVGSNIESFGGFATGRRVFAVFNDDPVAFEQIKALLESAGILSENAQEVKYGSAQDIVDAVFSNSVRGAYGDAFRMIPAAAANPTRVVLTPRLYDPKPIAFGLPRNDADFRLLLETTLQEMAKDGAYARIWQATFNVGDPLKIVTIPGTTEIFGIKTTN